MFLVVAGPTVAEHLAARLALGSAFRWMWWVLQWPVVFVLVATAIGIVYAAPERRAPKPSDLVMGALALAPAALVAAKKVHDKLAGVKPRSDPRLTPA